LKRNNLYIISIILLSSCGDGGSAKTDEPTPDTAIGLTLSKKLQPHHPLARQTLSQ